MAAYLSKRDLTEAIVEYRADPSDADRVNRLVGYLYLLAENILKKFAFDNDELEEFRQAAVALSWTKLDRFDPAHPRANSFSFVTTVMLNEMRGVWRKNDRQRILAEQYGKVLSDKNYQGRKVRPARRGDD